MLSRKFMYAANAVMPPIISISEESAVLTAARMILNGDVIALPTDTIYGFAVSAQNNNGIKKLYEMKRRDMNKPIAICISSIEETKLWGETSHLEDGLLDSLLPGAVTIVLKRKALLNPLLNPHTNLIGIRIPKFSFIQNLSRMCGIPLALTSANLSTETSPLNISEFIHLWPELGGIFDAGTLGNLSVTDRAGSTVVDLSEPNYFNIIRSGSALESTLALLKKYNLKEKTN
ncbi:hypothetical protein RUM43_013754 [Polyplax serrata]|uniref:Threonylcarbamoyl-AMP synthase n=1 Tax=Polyplax serrata TaxID=468196 RepID=A0AAN8S3N5_POLSC